MTSTLVGIRVNDLLDVITHSFVDVGTFSTLIARGSQERRFLFLQNDGGEDIYLMFGRPAALHQGILLERGSAAMFSQCNASLCPIDLYAITKSNKPVRILITEGR